MARPRPEVILDEVVQRPLLRHPQHARYDQPRLPIDPLDELVAAATPAAGHLRAGGAAVDSTLVGEDHRTGRPAEVLAAADDRERQRRVLCRLVGNARPEGAAA